MSELQQISQWMEGLTHCGLYYEGYTDDVQQMLTILQCLKIRIKCKERYPKFKWVTTYRGVVVQIDESLFRHKAKVIPIAGTC